MRVFYVNRLIIILILIAALVVLTAVISVPVTQTLQRVSPETREYWKGSNDIIWHVNTSQKMIALTFDDGPSPTFTPQIIEILKKNNVKGTFFVIAKEAEKYPEIVRRAVYLGNEIGNHTYNHNYLNRYTEDEFRQELILAESAILKSARVKPKLFRPPGGYYNENIVKVSKKHGYKVIIWSWEQQPVDWANPGTEAIIRRVLKNVGSGNIIVFHDRGGDRRQTVQALQPVIDGLKEKGFKMVTVSEMLDNGYRT